MRRKFLISFALLFLTPFLAYAAGLIVPQGGTGRTSLTSTNVLFGEGTSPVGVDAGLTYNKTTDTLSSGEIVDAGLILPGGVQGVVFSTSGGKLDTSELFKFDGVTLRIWNGEIEVDYVDINTYGGMVINANSDGNGNALLVQGATGYSGRFETISGNAIETVGNVVIDGALLLEETGVGTDKITIQAPSSIAAAYTLTLPVDDGGSGEVLTTDGSGVLSWSAISAGANTALSNLASVAINTTLVSDTNNTDDLGTTSIAWRTGYFATSVFSPLIVGGSATTSDLFLKTTSGVGTTGADMHFLVGNNGATEAMTILNSGNVGIGTTAPQSLLDAQGPVGTGATGAGILTLATKELTIVDDDQLGRINFNSPLESDGSDSILAGASIWGEAEATFSATVNNTALVFGTATTSAAIERMRINASGNVGIGTASPRATSAGGLTLGPVNGTGYSTKADLLPVLSTTPLTYDSSGTPSVNKWVFYENSGAFVGGAGFSTNSFDFLNGPSGGYNFYTGTTNVNGTGASRILSVSSAGALALTNSTTGTHNIATLLSPSVSSGNLVGFLVGRSLSTNNSFGLAFKYVGSGSASNVGFFSMYGVGNLGAWGNGGISVGNTYSGNNTPTANGLAVEGSVGIGNSAPSYPLDVTGTARADIFRSYNFGVDNVAGAATYAVGTVTFNAEPADGDLVTITDGDSGVLIFEMDNDASCADFGGDVCVSLQGNATDSASNFAFEIPNYLNISVVDNADGSISLTQNTAGTAGNVAITENGADIAVTGMSGGTDAVTGAYSFGGGIINSVADTVQIGPNDSAKITILSDGKTGIGTESPGAILDITGDLMVDSITNDTGLAHGTYTPTLTNTTNVGASTARLSTYSRVGNTVTVSGQFSIDPTAPGATLMGISLPVASNFGTVYEAGGTASATGIAGMTGGIEADPTNDRVSLKFIATDITNQPMTFTFTYQVI